MIEISNWVANLFLLGLGSVFLGLGLIMIMGIIAGMMDIFRRPFIPKPNKKADVG